MRRIFMSSVLTAALCSQFGCEAPDNVGDVETEGDETTPNPESTPRGVARGDAPDAATTTLMAGNPGNNLETTASADADDEVQIATYQPTHQSTTGPLPPRAVIDRDNEQRFRLRGQVTGGKVIDDVPAYMWRHGCGPTAVGMVVGYYDGQGYDLIDGDAGNQTNVVNQAIASGGDQGNPFPAGREQHFEDYAVPIDDTSNTVIDDDYITAGRPPHQDNCIADFMDTSKSTDGNKYGWSWDSDVSPSFIDYVKLKDSSLSPESNSYWHVNWQTVTTEIDNNRPMVFLVDTDGNGSTDHFVTIIGYREIGGVREYACHDTWYADLRWEAFEYMTNGQPWGVAEGFTFRIADGSNGDATPIPARIQAEDYVRAYDTTAGNTGGDCDTGDDVDKEITGDTAGGGCNIGWTAAGEWLEYDITAATAQAFDISARVASESSGRSFRIEIDGVDVTGPLSVPANGWQSYADVVAPNILISAGDHVVRLFMITDSINVNYLDFALSGTTSECGDGTCDPAENCDACPDDCGDCPIYCPNGTCEPWEGCDTCPADCGTCPEFFCGDGTCNPTEDCDSCPGDCGACQTGGCTCPSGCDALVPASVPFAKSGADNNCYFFNGSLGNYLNSWVAEAVNLNGTDVTNSYLGSNQYPEPVDGGYYLYFRGNFPWSHVECN